jgi:hypothetical protein
MTLDEIKAAVKAGQTVIWGNPGYRVIVDSLGQWMVRCSWNGYCFGLTHSNGVTMNGKPADFAILHEVCECA